MQANQHDLETLVMIQEIDQEINRLNKEFDSLPQRQIILKARTSRSAIEEKLDKASKLKNDVSKKLTRINDEDASLEKKEKGVQAAIEAAHGDFRSVEARTKELNGIFKRRKTLAEDRIKEEEELSKIESILSEIEKLKQENDTKEFKATESFKTQGGNLKSSIAAANSRRESLLLSIDPVISKMYSETLQNVGTVAVGKLEDVKCGICRARIEGGHLIDLRAEAPLGVCPSCGRMLIIE